MSGQRCEHVRGDSVRFELRMRFELRIFGIVVTEKVNTRVINLYLLARGVEISPGLIRCYYIIKSCSISKVTVASHSLSPQH